MDIDLSPALETFAQPVTLYRYSYYFDDNGERHLDEDNPTTFEIMASVQRVDSEEEWQEGGVNRAETRLLYSFYPPRNTEGNELDIQPRTQESVSEEEPVDIIKYHGQLFDLTGMVADYQEAGYQGFVMTRV